MNKIRLTREEKQIEQDIIDGKYQSVSQKEFERIAESIAARKKDAVLNIRMNAGDLKSLKQKAKKLGVKYQTFISEILHRVAQS